MLGIARTPARPPRNTDTYRLSMPTLEDGRSLRLTRHKISDREPVKAGHATEARMADTQNVSRGLARGSLHRLVRRLEVAIV